MSYVKNNLMPGERIVYSAKLSLWSLAPLIVIGLILCVFLIGFLILLHVFLKYISTELAITNRRVIAKSGFIRRDTVELDIRRIESVRVTQGIFGRMLGFGSIIVAGAGNPQAPIAGISQPMVFRQVFNEEREGLLSNPSSILASQS